MADDIDSIVDINADKETVVHALYETEDYDFIVEYSEPPANAEDDFDVLSFTINTGYSSSSLSIMDADVEDLRTIADMLTKVADEVDEMKGNVSKEADVLPFKKPNKDKGKTE